MVRVCQDFMNQRITSCSSLADIISPDLSPIEHLWEELGRRVRHRQNPPETLQELPDALVHEWNNILQAFIQRLIGSRRRRCEAVVSAKGGHTRYLAPQTSILHDNMNLNYTIFVDFVSLCKKY